MELHCTPQVPHAPSLISLSHGYMAGTIVQLHPPFLWVLKIFPIPPSLYLTPDPFSFLSLVSSLHPSPLFQVTSPPSCWRVTRAGGRCGVQCSLNSSHSVVQLPHTCHLQGNLSQQPALLSVCVYICTMWIQLVSRVNFLADTVE